jgi:pimeloyl-ACP methyl ester carboxylesterase
MRTFTVTEEQLRANRVPTLAIIGEIDPLKVTVDELSRVMSNLQVYVIKDADHMRAFVRPEFMQALKDFLAAHATRPVAESIQ